MIPFLRHFCMHIQGEKDIKKYITLKLIYWNYLSVRLCPLSRGTQLLFLISASFSNIFLSDLLSVLTQQTYWCFIKKDEIWRIIDLIKISKYCWNKHAEKSAHKLSVNCILHILNMCIQFEDKIGSHSPNESSSIFSVKQGNDLISMA